MGRKKKYKKHLDDAATCFSLHLPLRVTCSQCLVKSCKSDQCQKVWKHTIGAKNSDAEIRMFLDVWIFLENCGYQPPSNYRNLKRKEVYKQYIIDQKELQRNARSQDSCLATFSTETDENPGCTPTKAPQTLPSPKKQNFIMRSVAKVINSVLSPPPSEISLSPEAISPPDKSPTRISLTRRRLFEDGLCQTTDSDAPSSPTVKAQQYPLLASLNLENGFETEEDKIIGKKLLSEIVHAMDKAGGSLEFKTKGNNVTARLVSIPRAKTRDSFFRAEKMKCWLDEIIDQIASSRSEKDESGSTKYSAVSWICETLAGKCKDDFIEVAEKVGIRENKKMSAAEATAMFTAAGSNEKF